MTIAGGSLHQRVSRTLVGLALVGIMGVTGLLWISGSAQARSLEATRRFVEDERTSDRITRAVLRQLAIATTFSTASDAGPRENFLASGRVVHDELRRYLYRALTPEERLSLAEVREAHQRFEVEAINAAELSVLGADRDARPEMEVMAALVDDFLLRLGGFFTIRLDALDDLQRTQEATRAYLVRGALVLGFGLVALSLLAGWELSRRVTRPLADLARVTERIAGGERGARMPAGGDHEFRELAERFNWMTTALEQREAELTEALAEIEEAQAELIASEKLRAVGRMSAGLAHELNNPLTSVLGYAELLAEQFEGGRTPRGPEARELLGPILTESARARGLVRSFLQVARRPTETLGSVPLRNALDVVVHLRTFAFEQAGLELRLEKIPDVEVHAAPDLMHGMFVNLINNAYDAMRDQGHGALTISGTLIQTEECVELCFADSGPGMIDADRVFEPFYTTKPVGEGTGLGLSLVYQFVTTFGGSVRAENHATGGARVVLRLPLAGADMARSPGRGAETHAASDSGSSGAEPSPAHATPGETMTVLVVEDEPHLLRLQERLLSRLNVRALLAESAAEARRLLESERVDAIVSDVRMPGENGAELYEWIQRSHPRLAGRFLFVTGDSRSPELAGIQDDVEEIILLKPFDVGEYLERVQALLV